MSVGWRALPQATMVSVAMLSGALLGCRADANEQAGGDVVIERVSDPLRVVDVDMGRGLGPDNRVIESTEEFRTNDTIYASVVMLGRADEAMLKARWSDVSGALIDETVRTVSPIGETITEFHLVKPAGWPKGKYRVEIVLDGATVGREEFEVS